MNPEHEACPQNALNALRLKKYEFTIRCDECDNPAIVGRCVRRLPARFLCAAHRCLDIIDVEKMWGPLKAEFVTEVKL